MARKSMFTKEQIAELRANPNVYSVTEYILTLTAEFKQLFWEEMQNGKYPRDILIENGISIETIGEKRLCGIAYHIREEFAKYGSFSETRRPRTEKHKKDMSDESRISRVEAELKYVKQEMEFLKKTFKAVTAGGRNK